MRISVTYRQYIGLHFSNPRLMRTETCVHRPRVVTSNHLGPSYLDCGRLVPPRDDSQEWEDLVVPCL